MKSLVTFAATIVCAAMSTPALAEGNADAHAGLSNSCAWGACTGTKLSYGVALGYDFDVGKDVFIGAQAGVDAIKGADNGSYANYALLGRLGTRFDAESLYVLGGYAAQELGGNAGRAPGWRLGVGYEHSFTKSFFIKAQYTYSQYSKYGITGGQNTGTIGVGTHF